MKATITATEGSFPEADFGGRLTPEPSIGYALGRLSAQARSTNTSISVVVDNGRARLPLLVDASGRIHANPGVPPRPHHPPSHRPSAESPPTPQNTPTPAAGAPSSTARPGTADSLPPARPLLPPPGTAPAQRLTFTDTEDIIPALAARTGVPVMPAELLSGNALGISSSSATPPGTTPVSIAEVLASAPGLTPHSSRPRRGRLIAIAVIAAIVAGGTAFYLMRPGAADEQAEPAVEDSTDLVELSAAPPLTDAASATESAPEDPDAPIVPGFNEQSWHHALPEGASVTALAHDLLILDRGTLRVLDSNTGDVRYETAFDDPVTFAADADIAGEPAVVWRSGTDVHSLLRTAEETIEYTVSEGAQMSAGGTAVLIRDGDELSTLGESDVLPLPSPAEGFTAIAIDGTTLITGAGGSVITVDAAADSSDANAANAHAILLEAPGEDYSVESWKGAGHGLAVTLWRSENDDTERVAVHRLNDGSLSAALDAPVGSSGPASWQIGQGGALAALGPLLFNVETGELLVDGTSEVIAFSAPRGELAVGTRGDDPIVVTGSTDGSPTLHHLNEESTVEGMSPDGSVIIRDADGLTAHSRD